jgi:hypothetical protein
MVKIVPKTVQTTGHVFAKFEGFGSLSQHLQHKPKNFSEKHLT